eukprot:gene20207-27684_t
MAEWLFRLPSAGRERGGLRRVLVRDGRCGRCHNFTGVIMATSATDVVRALQFAAVGAFCRICSHKRVMGAAHIALGGGRTILRDSHRSKPLISLLDEARNIDGFGLLASPFLQVFHMPVTEAASRHWSGSGFVAVF